MVRNPVRREMVSRVPLDVGSVDHMVFITKDPSPMLPYLPDISETYSVSFQITITPYGRDVEFNVPESDRVISFLKEVSEILGSDRVIWRFDPILFSDKYDEETIVSGFREMCAQMSGYVDRCVFTFLEHYPKIEPIIGGLGIRECRDRKRFVSSLNECASSFDIRLSTCTADLYVDHPLPIHSGACIDTMSMRRWGIPYEMPSTPVRKGCGCVKTVDIGDYDTCMHNCAYCYANSSSVKSRSDKVYDPDSEFICGYGEHTDIVRELGSKSQSKLSIR